MKIFKTVQELTSFRTFTKGSTGFVPTMGALHSGHLSLIRSSKNENDFTGCSIFVNPIQFTNPEDFEKYPSTLDQDLKLLEEEGCDWVFTPSVLEMYPKTVSLKFDFGNLENVMEGAFRPGHFNGVAIVVSKLFHAALPQRAYFGRKDLQQTLVIKQLTTDLGFNLEIRVQETLREADGLAMSSRNVRLDQFQRQLAPVIYQTISFLQTKILEGEKIEEMIAAAKYNLLTVKGLRLEYLEVANASNLQSIDNSYKGDIAICIACYLGNVRLIDNVVFMKS
ncbi:MAG: pantoate--beta-alanine ligase [Opitutaceae bacterium]|nr:pantoate--beta-alanine ligase [Cytophagales bacterium]